MQYHNVRFLMIFLKSGSFMTLNNGAHKSYNQNNERLQLKKESFRALLVELKVNFSSVIPSQI